MRLWCPAVPQRPPFGAKRIKIPIVKVVENNHLLVKLVDFNRSNEIYFS
jgi:hypothetical protein